MKSVLYTVVLVVSYVQSVLSIDNYTEYDLESFRLCSHGRDEASIYISPWKAAIIRFGNKIKDNGSPTGQKIDECKISVTTNKDYGLTAVIEDMMIGATINRMTNGWICQGDYVRMSTSGKSDVLRILDDIFPGDLFKSKKTEKLCGTRRKKQVFTDVGSNANVLFTLASNLEVLFKQKKSISNNSFTIVITSFKHIKDYVFTEHCEGMYKCGDHDVCIDPAFLCDGHYNCAFPSGGEDEQQCIVKMINDPIFSTTTTIITSLASIFVICCLFVIIMKAKSRNSSQSGNPLPANGLASDTSAPSLQRQHTLPRYEAVVMSDLNQSQKSSAPSSPEVGELPPSYNTLFPDGPPKDVEPENTHTEEQTPAIQAAIS